MRDQQVEIAGPPDLGNAMVARHQEERRHRHRLPRHHERVGVVREQDERHAGEEKVVPHALNARLRTLARPQVAGCKHRNAGRDRAEDEQEVRRQRVDAEVERQVGQPEREDGLVRRLADRHERGGGERESGQGAERIEDLRHEPQRVRRADADRRDREPGRRDRERSGEGRDAHRASGYFKGSTTAGINQARSRALRARR